MVRKQGHGTGSKRQRRWAEMFPTWERCEHKCPTHGVWAHKIPTESVWMPEVEERVFEGKIVKVVVKETRIPIEPMTCHMPAFRECAECIEVPTGYGKPLMKGVTR